MLNVPEDVNNLKTTLDSALESLKSIGGSSTHRLDQLETLVADMTTYIVQQTAAIAKINKTNIILIEEISQLKGRVLLLESVRDNPFKFSGNN